MPMETEPVVGAVYEDSEGQQFEVIGFDENVGTIEIRYADGTTDEIDLDAWYGMDVEEIEEGNGWDEDEDEFEEVDDEDDDLGDEDYDEDEQ